MTLLLDRLVNVRFRTALGSLAKSEFLIKCGNLSRNYNRPPQQGELAKLVGTAETFTSGGVDLSSANLNLAFGPRDKTRTEGFLIELNA